MRTFARRLIKTLAVIAGLVVLFLLAGQVGLLDLALQPGERVPIDFATLERPKSPNTYLVASPGLTQAKVDEDAPVLGDPVEKLKAKWEKMIAAQPRVTKIAESADGLQIDYIQRTRLVHYPDWITVRFVPQKSDEGDYATLALYSRSVYGYGDLGANKARVQAWLKALIAL